MYVFTLSSSCSPPRFCSFLLVLFIINLWTQFWLDYYDPYFVNKRPKRTDLATGIVASLHLPLVPSFLLLTLALLFLTSLFSFFVNIVPGTPILDASLSGDFQRNNCMPKLYCLFFSSLFFILYIIIACFTCIFLYYYYLFLVTLINRDGAHTTIREGDRFSRTTLWNLDRCFWCNFRNLW